MYRKQLYSEFLSYCNNVVHNVYDQYSTLSIDLEMPHSMVKRLIVILPPSDINVPDYAYLHILNIIGKIQDINTFEYHYYYRAIYVKNKGSRIVKSNKLPTIDTTTTIVSYRMLFKRTNITINNILCDVDIYIFNNGIVEPSNISGKLKRIIKKLHKIYIPPMIYTINSNPNCCDIDSIPISMERIDDQFIRLSVMVNNVAYYAYLSNDIKDNIAMDNPSIKPIIYGWLSLIGHSTNTSNSLLDNIILLPLYSEPFCKPQYIDLSSNKHSITLTSRWINHIIIHEADVMPSYSKHLVYAPINIKYAYNLDSQLPSLFKLIPHQLAQYSYQLPNSRGGVPTTPTPSLSAVYNMLIKPTIIDAGIVDDVCMHKLVHIKYNMETINIYLPLSINSDDRMVILLRLFAAIGYCTNLVLHDNIYLPPSSNIKYIDINTVTIKYKHNGHIYFIDSISTTQCTINEPNILSVGGDRCCTSIRKLPIHNDVITAGILYRLCGQN